MDVVKIEAFSFLRQEVTQRIIIEACSQNQSFQCLCTCTESVFSHAGHQTCIQHLPHTVLR